MRVIVTEEKICLRDYLLEHVKLSRQTLKKIKFSGGAIYVNDVLEHVRKEVVRGDIIDLVLPKETRSKTLTPVYVPLDIVYEDDFLMIVNKPAHLAVVPTIGNHEVTLAHGLIHYYDHLQLPYTVHIVTRLDKNTSGLMLIAKHQLAHGLFKEVEINREYLALVEGTLTKKCGEIIEPIARAQDSIIKRCVSISGKYAKTCYRVLKTFHHMSYVKIKLETGRTHQIRVHFSHIGHPLVGDTLYGAKRNRCDRHALHCHALKFVHPYTKALIELTLPWPNDLPVIQ